MRLIKRRSSTSLSQQGSSTSFATSPIDTLTPTPVAVPPLPSSSTSDDGPSSSPTKSGSLRGRKKRDSQEMKYPPTSFGQGGTGWSFGRMRSFKGKPRASQDGTVSGSEDEGNVEGKGKGKKPLLDTLNVNSLPIPTPVFSSSPVNYSIPLHAKAPVTPIPPPTPPYLLDNVATPDFTESPSLGSSLSSQYPYPQPNQPLIAFTPSASNPAPVAALATAQTESIFPPSGSRPPLTTSASTNSSAPSFESGESSYPFIPRGDDNQPHKRVTTSPTSPRKLTKRRPVSVVYDQVELMERPSTSPDQGSYDPRPFHNYNSSPNIYTVLSAPLQPSSNLPLPEGAAPPHHLNWPLNRNPSCSTNASSGLTPSTDESGTLETPNNAVLIPGQGEGNLWERIGEPRPPLSRASTFSSKEGDDGTIHIFKREGYFQQTNRRDISSSSGGTQTENGKFQSTASTDSSPTFHRTASGAKYTPTVSSGSDVTARQPRSIRVSTSNLELKTNKSETLISPTSSLQRRSVAFEVQPIAPEDTNRHNQDGNSRPVRPPLTRLRSSSLGAISIQTNSVYSVGEVTEATIAVVSPARPLEITGITSEPATIRGGIAGMLADFENSSEAVRRAFENERQRGDWPLSFPEEDPVPRIPVRRIHTARPAPPPRLASPLKKNARPPLSPILRSSISSNSPKKLVSFNANTNTTGDEEVAQSSPKRPSMPSRSSSLSRLWRRLSTGGSGVKMKKSKSSMENLKEGIPPVPQVKKNEWYGSLSDSPTKMASNSLEKVMSTRMRRSKGSLDLTSIEKENPDFLSSLRPLISTEPERPTTPSSTNSKRSKGKKRMSSIPPPRAQSVPLPIRSDTPPVIPPLSPAPPLRNRLPSPGLAPVLSDHLPPVSDNLNAAEAGSSTSTPARSFRKLSAPPSSGSAWKTPLGPYTPPLSAIVNDYFRDLKTSTLLESSESIFNREVTLHRTSLHEDKEYQSYDAKRRYRQSLVEIKDDQAFQATVEELVKLESDGRVRITRAGGAALRNDQITPMYRTPSKDLLEKQARQENIRAWFVTRELVQGERRHGRLLAKGVAAVRLAAQGHKDLPPVPPLPTDEDAVIPRPIQSLGHARSGSGNIKTPSRLRRSRTSNPSSSTNTPAPSRPTSVTSSPTSTSVPLPPLPTAYSYTPIEILLIQLPKLYSLSLKLSERFEHDPSPYGVADAFVSMEEYITKEVSEWAKRIGEVVYSGIGDELNKVLENQKLSLSTSKRGRRRISEGGTGNDGLNTEGEEEEEDRFKFADIIIVPIQRASRYKLLFQELSTKLTPTSHTSLKIQRALEASIRLASECDRCQSFDLNALRRQGKKGKRVRPVSVGPGVGVW
ncbi:hypothetical protein I204_01968 [Kwoniella mangroviensis CBS 8886]|uniref:uncharacterized protein n=1 Tax=Kwoniella mangroviensis CBS 8507 TaxID=1296122 RepID=UPI00080CC12F|nr:uncharacterized protein I203_03726 [Kwoniella mangroviensis CBS 8507]OCF67043.1 hypothetical protein I203_03726 [Kwoniella mangroviensis CBS 8507]OCF77963.1 hypothetical protein I204_01968 [Kwoniella mangroviensis CBS 8886]